MRARTILLWIFVGCVVIAAALGVIGLLGGQGVLFEKTLMTSLIFGVACVPSMSLALVRERGRRRALGTFGFGAAGLAVALWLSVVWDVVQPRFVAPSALFEWTLRIAGTATVLCVWSAVYAPVSIVSFERWWGRATRLVALLCASIVSLMIIFWIYYDDLVSWIGEDYGRAMGVFVIVSVAAILAIPALRRLERAEREDVQESTVARRLFVSVRCPRCAAPQSLRANTHAACGSCGLRIRVDVDEPRCKCGYLLYGAAGDVCPECAAPIERWAADVSETNSSPSLS